MYPLPTALAPHAHCFMHTGCGIKLVTLTEGFRNKNLYAYFLKSYFEVQALKGKAINVLSSCLVSENVMYNFTCCSLKLGLTS